jgi:hypothetical protein
MQFILLDVSMGSASHLRLISFFFFFFLSLFESARAHMIRGCAFIVLSCEPQPTFLPVALSNEIQASML